LTKSKKFYKINNLAFGRGFTFGSSCMEKRPDNIGFLQNSGEDRRIRALKRVLFAMSLSELRSD
jgi:hypothetical protein